MATTIMYNDKALEMFQFAQHELAHIIQALGSFQVGNIATLKQAIELATEDCVATSISIVRSLDEVCPRTLCGYASENKILSKHESIMLLNDLDNSIKNLKQVWNSSMRKYYDHLYVITDLSLLQGKIRQLKVLITQSSHVSDWVQMDDNTERNRNKRKRDKITPVKYQMDSIESVISSVIEQGMGFIGSAVQKTFNTGLNRDSPALIDVRANDWALADVPRNIGSLGFKKEQIAPDSKLVVQHKTQKSMSLQQRCKVPSLLASFNPTVSCGSSPVLVGYFSCSPLALPAAITNSGEVRRVNTTLSYFAELFEFWRGEIEFDVQIIATEFHQGQLFMAFSPNLNTVDVADVLSVSNLMCASIDISDKNVYTFKIPFVSDTDYKRCIPNYGANLPQTGNTNRSFNAVPLPGSVGYFILYIQNPVVAPSTASPSFYVNVWIKAGSNFHFHTPRTPITQCFINGKWQNDEITDQSDESHIAGEDLVVPGTSDDGILAENPINEVAALETASTENVINRTYLVSTNRVWRSTDGFGATLFDGALPDLLIQNSRVAIKGIKDYHEFFRGGFTVTIRLASQKQYCGLAVLYFTPPNVDRVSTETLYTVRQYPHAFLDAGRTKTCSVYIPYTTITRLIRQNTALKSLGEVRLMVLNQLLVPPTSCAELRFSVHTKINHPYFAVKRVATQNKEGGTVPNTDNDVDSSTDPPQKDTSSTVAKTTEKLKTFKPRNRPVDSFIHPHDNVYDLVKRPNIVFLHDATGDFNMVISPELSPILLRFMTTYGFWSGSLRAHLTSDASAMDKTLMLFSPRFDGQSGTEVVQFFALNASILKTYNGNQIWKPNVEPAFTVEMPFMVETPLLFSTQSQSRPIQGYAVGSIYAYSFITPATGSISFSLAISAGDDFELYMPLAIPTTRFILETINDSRSVSFRPDSEWVRDLTSEGIEPNPGPLLMGWIKRQVRIMVDEIVDDQTEKFKQKVEELKNFLRKNLVFNVVEDVVVPILSVLLDIALHIRLMMKDPTPSTMVAAFMAIALRAYGVFKGCEGFLETARRCFETVFKSVIPKKDLDLNLPDDFEGSAVDGKKSWWRWQEGTSLTGIIATLGLAGVVGAVGHTLSGETVKSIQEAGNNRFFSSCKGLGNVGQGIRGMKDVWQAIKDGLSLAAEYIIDPLPEKTWWTENKVAFENMCSQYEILKSNNMFEPANIRNEKCGITAEKFLERAGPFLDQCHIHVPRLDIKDIPVARRLTLKDLVATRIKFLSFQTAQKPRHEPVGVWIYGKPGVAKSVFGKEFLPAVLTQKLKLPGSWETNVYHMPRSADQKYYDGYTNQYMAYLDDFGQAKDDDDFLDIINLISSANCPMNQARIEDKNCTFTSRVVIASTNLQNLSGITSIKTVDAVARRFPVAVELLLRENTQFIKDGLYFDYNKFIDALTEVVKNTSGDPQAVYSLYDTVFEIRKLNLLNNVNLTIGKNEYKFEQFIEDIIREVHKRDHPHPMGNLLSQVKFQSKIPNHNFKVLFSDPYPIDEIDSLRSMDASLIHLKHDDKKRKDNIFSLGTRVGNEKFGLNGNLEIGSVVTKHKNEANEADVYYATDFQVGSETANVGITTEKHVIVQAGNDGYIKFEDSSKVHYKGLTSLLKFMGFAAGAGLLCYFLISLIRTFVSEKVCDDEGIINVEPQHKYAATKQPAKGKEKSVVAKVKLNNSEKESKILRNVVRCTAGAGVSHALCLDNRHFLVNAHAIRDRTAAELYIPRKDGSVSTIKISLRGTSAIVRTRSESESDLALVRCVGANLDGIPSIWHLLQTRNDWAKVPKVVNAYFDKRRYTYTTTYRLLQAKADQPNFACHMAKGTGATVDGDCGKPYFADISAERTLLGIHSAIGLNTEGPNELFCTPIVLEDVRNAQDQLDLLFGKSVVIADYKLDNCVITVEGSGNKWDNGQLDKIGKVEKNGEAMSAIHLTTTSFIPSPIKHADWSDDYAPSCKVKVVQGDKVTHPLFSNAQKYALVPSAVAPEIILGAARIYIEKVASGIGEPLTEYEMLNGKGEMNKLVISTSAGYITKYHKKKDFFDVEEGPEVDGIKQPDILHFSSVAKNEILPIYQKTLCDTLKEYEEQLREGQKPDFFWISTNKDELLTKKKVAIGKTRVFENPDLLFTLLCRKYFGDFVVWFKSKRGFDLHHAIGIDREIAAKQIYDELRWKERVFDVDYSNFDGSVPQVLFDFFLYVTDHFYNKDIGDRIARHTLVDCLRSSLHIIGDTIYQSYQGNKSGNPMTDVFNSVVNAGFLYMVFFTVFKEPQDIRDHVDIITYGDDVLADVSEEAQSFNRKSIAFIAHKLGMKVTSADKTKEVIEAFTPINEVTFLKSHFDPGVPFRFPLPIEIIHRELMWERKATRGDELVLKQRVEQALMMAFHHGHIAFDKLKSQIKEAGFEKYGERITYQGYMETLLLKQSCPSDQLTLRDTIYRMDPEEDAEISLVRFQNDENPWNNNFEWPPRQPLLEFEDSGTYQIIKFQHTEDKIKINAKGIVLLGNVVLQSLPGRTKNDIEILSPHNVVIIKGSSYTKNGFTIWIPHKNMRNRISALGGLISDALLNDLEACLEEVDPTFYYVRWSTQYKPCLANVHIDNDQLQFIVDNQSADGLLHSTVDARSTVVIAAMEYDDGSSGIYTVYVKLDFEEEDDLGPIDDMDLGPNLDEDIAEVPHVVIDSHQNQFGVLLDEDFLLPNVEVLVENEFAALDLGDEVFEDPPVNEPPYIAEMHVFFDCPTIHCETL